MSNQERRTNPSAVRGIAAATIGSALEWYDVLIYAYVAPEIGRAFFPKEDPLVSTAIALGSFGVSYLARPLGGLVLGRFADRAGRRAGLVLVSALMFLATAIICVLPGYDRIGIAGPVLLFAARLLQGFSAGGEFGSGVAYLAEQNSRRRGFLTSWQFASQGFAIMLAAGVTASVSAMLTPAQMGEWGWRVPFALGLVIGPIAYYIRAHVAETAEFNSARLDHRDAPVLWGKVAIGTGMAALATAAIYSLVYLPTLGSGVLGLSKAAAQSCSVLSGAILLVATPVFGSFADRCGHWRLAGLSSAAMMLAAIPVFGLLDAAPGLAALALAEALLSVLASAYLAALSPCLATLFPVETRTFSLSVSYNVAVLAIGGFAPLGLATLTGMSPHHFILGAYPAGAALLALACVTIQAKSARPGARLRHASVGS